MIERSNRPISSCDVYMYAKGDRGQTTEGNQMRVKIPYVNQVRTSAMLCCLLLPAVAAASLARTPPALPAPTPLRLLHPHPLLTTHTLLLAPTGCACGGCLPRHGLCDGQGCAGPCSVRHLA